MSHTRPHSPGHRAVLGSLALLLATAGCQKATVPATGAADASKESQRTAAPVAKAEGSDLDRSVRDLLTATCEHKIPMYTCDECRYEVGVAKAGEEMFDPAQGGKLATIRAGSRPLGGGSDSNGEIRLNEERAVYLSPLAPGVVRSILVDLGVRVLPGQALFEVESNEFRQAKADLLRIEAALKLAEATATRERDLHEKGVCPRKDVLEAEAALGQTTAERSAVVGRLLAFGLDQHAIDQLLVGGAVSQSGLMPVRAPFAGTVLERSLSLGAQAQPGDKLLLLADTSRVWVITTVYEREVAALLRAQRLGPVQATVSVAAYPDLTFKGHVEQVGGTLDEATRTARVRVVVDNPENLLRAGMFARVQLLLPGASGGLTLPEQAVLEDEGRSFVFVRAEGPYFIRRPVKTGRTLDGWVEVGGIEPGAEVVVKGAFLLKSDVLRSKMGAGCAD
ncbi:MAG: efflux RND transporter periplasmic adaptor subunit [Thermoanaerobaculaceae bacterium]|nr:efflux RND transporter periplasmic adaptor subunit [Thermoanaerobaculaceae bacterium]